MRSVAKKIYISILTSVLVLVTSLATTYAWVGIFTYSETENVDIQIVAPSKGKNDFLVISSTGEPTDFKDNFSVSSEKIKSQIIKNMITAGSPLDDSLVDYNRPESINKFFDDKVELMPVTPVAKENGTLKFGEISDYRNVPTSYEDTYKYYKFDLYFSADTTEGINDTTYIDANISLTDIGSILTADDKFYDLINGNVLLTNPNRPEDLNKYDTLINLPKRIKTNSTSAARLAFEIYEPIDISDSYENQKNQNKHPYKTLIYQGGSKEPDILEGGVHSLGGILPEGYNFAVQEQNKLYSSNITMTDSIRSRNETDLELIKENKIIYSAGELDNNYLGVKNGVRTKMKITVYFWFEGWDADCLASIDLSPVNINLSFTSDIENN